MEDNKQVVVGTEEQEVASEENNEQNDLHEIARLNGISSDALDEVPEQNDGEVKKEEVNSGKEEAPIDEVDDLINKTRHGMQKRIDKLTAQSKEQNSENESLRAEIELLKSQLSSLTSNQPADGSQAKSEKQYTYEELDRAYEKAMTDGDVELMREIRKHERANYMRDAEKMYSQMARPNTEQIKALNEEWKQVERVFVPYSSDDGPEIYPGSREDLNIGNPQSRLVQLASAKYKTDAKYKVNGGIVLAFADAFKDILSARTKSRSSAKPEILKKKVNKLTIQNSQGLSHSMKSEGAVKPSKNKSKAEELDDYISWRRSK